MTEVERRRDRRPSVAALRRRLRAVQWSGAFLLKHDRRGCFALPRCESALGTGGAGALRHPRRSRRCRAGDGCADARWQQVYRRSDAVAEALRLLGGPWRAMGRALILRAALRCASAGYGVVARVRYRVFGRYDGLSRCQLRQQRDRFAGLGRRDSVMWNGCSQGFRGVSCPARLKLFVFA